MVSELYSFVLTEIAEEDVDEILDYIANDLLNPEAAADFADELSEKLEEVCKMPKTGRPVHNPYLKRDDVRRILVKNYIAYYLINEEKSQIVVLRVVYNKRDQNKVLKSL